MILLSPAEVHLVRQLETVACTMPPRDPNDNDDDEDLADEEDGENEDQPEPPVVREPHEGRRLGPPPRLAAGEAQREQRP